MADGRVGEGVPEPLGVVADAAGVNVAVVAPEATGVEFCLFDATGTVELARHALPGRCGAVWHGHVPGVAPGARYGLRAHGPWDPEVGHRFNAAKLLVDPWATALDRPFRLDPVLFDTGDRPDAADSVAAVPKAIVAPPPAPPAPPVPLPAGPRVIYELHVRGFTMRHPGVPEAIRGTFAGLAHPAAIAHLKALGVTHVELLPVAAGVDERHLPPLGLTNYWNYNPVAFLVPCPKLAPGGMAEVRAAVAALREVGIGTILDVVFNHSGEGDADGPTLSLRGLGNAGFYRVRGRGYANDSGCGNTLALDRPWPLRLVMDALRHWAVQAGVAGFRLDLAATLGRRDHGFDPEAPLLSAMRQDPVLRHCLIIAEPWDIGMGGYQLGRFPPGWGEWNDRFRDTVRRFWRGDAGMLGELATRFAGSADLFGPGRSLADSVNFVTAHDGFTMADLVSFTHRRNEANGEQNRDGGGENHSWNHGTEGPSDDPAVRARRAADVRALLATLLLARGTPMLSMGDEAGRSQGGNNNAYAQDNALSWFDWAGMDAGLAAYAGRLVRARLAHPALHAAARLTGAGDVAWLRPEGGAFEDWHSGRSIVVLLQAAGDRVLVALHGGDVPCPLVLPPPRPGFAWRLLADSAGEAGPETRPLAPRSVRLLAEAAT
ncbi:glycogen debranching protein GlgX [Paeniroseomonas aquatica]|uniref:Glycogen debranching protein GlgX n=1 Tax=Paeniroseomonas aquatica TaxID=373043 RepID=A0ABT8A5J3_9PROT|nr:glycogen debranching protein GlgX [Paeniroseomonas aquatica]MDN3564676.1 glycogen debranching protein GlgX [Paeniroseomonas aquatica]